MEQTAGRWAVALDIGGTHVTASAVDLNSGRISQESRSTLAVESKSAAEPILEVWSQAAAHAIQSRANDIKFCGIGLAMPGPFDYERGICWIKGVEKYESLYGLNIRALLKDRLGLPSNAPILFRNDAECFLLGECAYGAARGWRNVIAITLGTGFGSAFMRDGEVASEGPGVPDGGYFYYQPWKNQTAEDFFSTRGLLSRYKVAGGGTVDGAKDISTRAEAGEAIATQTFKEFGKELAEFLAPWAIAMPADGIVVGGNISRAWTWFAPPLIESLKSAAPDVMVKPSALFEDAALLGAASLTLRYREPAE